MGRKNRFTSKSAAGIEQGKAIFSPEDDVEEKRGEGVAHEEISKKLIRGEVEGEEKEYVDAVNNNKKLNCVFRTILSLRQGGAGVLL